jgi:hypothetical protein
MGRIAQRDKAHVGSRADNDEHQQERSQQRLRKQYE